MQPGEASLLHLSTALLHLPWFPPALSPDASWPLFLLIPHYSQFNFIISPEVMTLALPLLAVVFVIFLAVTFLNAF